MRKKLIIAITAVSLGFVVAVMLLIYMETSKGNETPDVTEPSVSAEEQLGTSETLVQTEPSQNSEPVNSWDDLIVVPDNDQTEQSVQDQPEEQTEYTPPDGYDEDQTPIL